MTVPNPALPNPDGPDPTGPDPVAPGGRFETVPDEPAVRTEVVDIRRLVRTAVPVAAGLLVLGALGGVVWGLLTPGVTGIVIRRGEAGALGADTGHRFDGVAIFACLAFVVGVLGGVATWSVRRLRGPAAVAVAALGSTGGAALGIWVGGLVAGARLTGPSGTPVGKYFRSAPSLRLADARLDMFGGIDLSWALVVVAPIGALLACLVLLLTGREPDLGVPSDADAGADSALSGVGTDSRGRPERGELVGDA